MICVTFMSVLDFNTVIWYVFWCIPNDLKRVSKFSNHVFKFSAIFQFVQTYDLRARESSRVRLPRHSLSICPLTIPKLLRCFQPDLSILLGNLSTLNSTGKDSDLGRYFLGAQNSKLLIWWQKPCGSPPGLIRCVFLESRAVFSINVSRIVHFFH